jgi:hypothetical protein
LRYYGWGWFKFTVRRGEGRTQVHALVPGPTIFQNTAAEVMFVPEVLELAGTSELSGVYAGYLLAHLLLPEKVNLHLK